MASFFRLGQFLKYKAGTYAARKQLHEYWQSISTALRRLLSPSQTIVVDVSVGNEHLFRPTSGRWLWDEAHQLSQHTRRFDERALEEVAATAMGAEPRSGSIHIKKLAEGASNKVFMATGHNRRAIIKIPDPVVPAHLVTASEVATLEYLRTELGLPVPKVFAWSMTSDNPVGCEYIIMEEASGDALNTVWPSLEIDKKFTVIDQILSLQNRLLQGGIGLGGHGSLYFTEDAIALGFSKQLSVVAKTSARFCLGPLAKQDFLDPVVRAAGVDCGPWRLSQDYLIAVADSSVAKIKNRQESLKSYHLSKPPFSFPTNPCSDTSPAAALKLLNQHRIAVPYLIPRSQGASDLSQPVLWHGDLHCGNIFISSTGTITSIIDWQGTAALPLFLQAKIPQFLEVDSGSLLLELPEQFSSTPEPDKTKIWNDYRQSMLQQYYLCSLQNVVPEVAQILDDDPLVTVRQLAATLRGGTFDREADVLLLRELLIRIQRNWTDITSANSSHPRCPISISHEELSRHRTDGRRWNEFKDLLRSRGIPVAQEGWVPKEEFEMQRDNLRLLLREILTSFQDEKERQQFLENIALWDLTDC